MCPGSPSLHLSRTADIVAEKEMFTLLGPKSDRGGHECCAADFGFKIKISEHPLGRSAWFFEIYLFRLLGSGGVAPRFCPLRPTKFH